MQTGHLYDEDRECVVIEDSACFRTFEFRDRTWTVRDSIPFEPTADTNPVTAWTTGDLRDEGQDEIIASAGRTVVLYSWNGKTFVATSYRLPGLADDMKVGDIDNDGRNELVMLTHQRPFPDSGDQCAYDVVVARVDADSVATIWEDKGSLGVEHSNMIPSDELDCIADVQGSGHNQLLCQKGQSDVSATEYMVSEWTDRGLVNALSFTVSGGRLHKDPSDDIDYNPYAGGVGGHWTPVELEGERLFLAERSGAYQAYAVLLQINRGKLAVLDSLPSSAGFGRRSFWTDIDGQGKGILLGLPGHLFSFYR